MNRYYSDDPYRDFTRWDNDREEWLINRPVCDGCGDHIQDDYGYRIGDELYCQNCIDGWKEFID